jgi:hypothetical protein
MPQQANLTLFVNSSQLQGETSRSQSLPSSSYGLVGGITTTIRKNISFSNAGIASDLGRNARMKEIARSVSKLSWKFFRLSSEQQDEKYLTDIDET